MKPIISLLLLIAAISSWSWTAQSQAPVVASISGQHHEGEVFEDFVAQHGWIFVEDMAKGSGLPDLQGTPSSRAEGAPFAALEFDAKEFDPRHYAIEMNANPLRPTDYRVGNRGVLQFHSAQRCQDLYERHLARQAKGQ